MANHPIVCQNDLTLPAMPPVYELSISSSDERAPATSFPKPNLNPPRASPRPSIIDTATWAKIQNWILNRFQSRTHRDPSKDDTVGYLRKARTVEPPHTNTFLWTQMQLNPAHSSPIKRAWSIQGRPGERGETWFKYLGEQGPAQCLSNECRNAHQAMDPPPKPGEETWKFFQPNVNSTIRPRTTPECIIQHPQYVEPAPSLHPNHFLPTLPKTPNCFIVNHSAVTDQTEQSSQTGTPEVSLTSPSTYAPSAPEQGVCAVGHTCLAAQTSSTPTNAILGVDYELPFTADFWTWDEGAKNFFHIEPDGSKSWHPTEDEFD